MNSNSLKSIIMEFEHGEVDEVDELHFSTFWTVAILSKYGFKVNIFGSYGFGVS